MKLNLTARLLLMGEEKYDIDVEGITNIVLYNLRKRNGYNQDASKQHIAATYLSGSRYDKLKNLTTPCLIIHGTSDPLINFKHGKKCYEIIPDAQNMWIEGMGHDIPPIFSDRIISRITEHIENVPVENE